ncbi:MAG: hypothetical protein ACP5OU_03575 [Methanothrix sp.]
MNIQNPKLENVIEAYNKIQDNIPGKYLTSDVPLSSGGHIQGIAKYFNFKIISHSNDSDKRGYLCIYFLDKYKNKLEVPDTNHPGGIQIIGDVLVVPVEGANSSTIHFYRLDLMTEYNPIPDLLLYSLHLNKRCGGLGITNFTSNNIELYLLATYDNGAIDLYVSKEFPGHNWELKASRLCKESGYSEICLLTEVNQTVYMIGFRTTHIPTKNDMPTDYYDDYMDIYRINTNDWTITPLEDLSRHMIFKFKGTDSMYGVHFRWGAGIDIDKPTEKIWLYVTERDLGKNQTEYIECY